MTFYFDFWGVISAARLLADVAGALGDRLDGPISSSCGLPVVGLLAASWFICKACLRQALGFRARRTVAVGSRCCVSGRGGGMGDDPPTRARCLVARSYSLWLMLAFARTPRISLLATATVVLALALSAHPTGPGGCGAAHCGCAARVPEVSERAECWQRRSRGSASQPSHSLSSLVTLDTAMSHLVVDAKIARTGDTHAYSIWDESSVHPIRGVRSGSLPRLSLGLVLGFVVAVLCSDEISSR